ncbi:MAG: tyrosine-type recombinase/integrase [Kiritimatiellae bacterium]|jgi:integrase|nr:tyrosine-type recombinase/integrase [Kiritimatiellia bacterium]
MAYVRRIPNRKVWIACFIDKNGNRKSKTTGTRNRKEAEKIAEQYEAIAKGRATFTAIQKAMAELCEEYTGEALPSYSVREYFTLFLERKAPRVNPTTLKKYEGATASLMQGLGEKADNHISNVSTGDLNTWQLEELKRIRPGTLQLYTRLVRQVFKQAQAEGHRPDNPAALLEALAKEKAVRKAFTPDQVRDLLRIASPEWKSLILFAVYTGQRLGDIAALTWEAVDPEKGLITLRTQKTGNELHIPIAGPLFRHIGTLPTPKSNAAPLHPKAAGKSVPKLGSEFAALLVDAGIREAPKKGEGPGTRAAKRTRNEYSFHCFRHTAVSMMKSAGIGESIVMDLIGHESEAVSRGYTHLDLESKRAALATMPDLLEEA